MKESLDNWNVLWSDFTVTCERIKNLKRYQKVNHFPGMIEICRKDLLARNLNRMLKLFPDDYDFYPKTWLLPTDYTEVVEFARSHKSRTYILKPDLGCKGKGILLTKSLKQLSGMERTICQVYVSKPFLIDGFKFDLRVYALLTSCDPLRLYVYNEGLARYQVIIGFKYYIINGFPMLYTIIKLHFSKFETYHLIISSNRLLQPQAGCCRFATKNYEEPSKANITNMYMHLTNYSVNKFSRTYKIDPEEGSKRKLSTLNEILRSEYHDVMKIWKEIDDVIVKTVFLALPTLQHSYRAAIPKQNNMKTCFEILGFDLILDENLKPYLLEVNHSPSFHTDAPIDREVKESLLKDTFKILNLPKNNKNKIMEEDRKTTASRLLKDLASTQDSNWNRDLENYSMEEALRKSDGFELENLGNFRRIYPSENWERYNKYFCQGTSSLFNNTFASRARERATQLDLHTQVERRYNDASPDERPSNLLARDKSFEWILNKVKGEKQMEKIKEEKSTNEKAEEAGGKGKESESRKLLPNLHSSFFLNSPIQERRITRFNEKQELLESVNVLQKIHSSMKTFGELRLKKEIKKVRKNKWSSPTDGVDKKRISLQNSLSDVIQHIDNGKLTPFEPQLNWRAYVESVPKK